METLKLNKTQKKEYQEKLDKFSLRGIEIGKTVELWLDANRLCVNETNLGEESIQAYKKEHVCFYKDQYGIIQSAALIKRHFATIVKMEPSDYNGICVNLYAEDDDFNFVLYGSNNHSEWARIPKNGIGNVIDFAFAENSYNGPILFLDKEGNRPIPHTPIVICKEHDFAHHESEQCMKCSYPHDRLSELLPLRNLLQINLKNNDIYLVK